MNKNVKAGQFKVVVVTPVFNSCDYITRTLQSIFVATTSSPDLEVYHYVADASSTDGTSEIISEFIAANKSANYEVQHVIEPDHGMYDALAKGFSNSLKPDVNVYCYLNAGDCYSPQVFNILFDYFSNGVDWLTGLNVFYNENGELINAVLPLNYDNKLLTRGYYGTCLPFIQQESTFWSSEAMKLLNLKRMSKYKLAGDYYIWHSLSKNNMKLNIVNVWLGGFAFNDGQLSGKYFSEYLIEFNSIRDSRSPFDIFKVLFIKVCWYLPSKIKLNLNKNILSR